MTGRVDIIMRGGERRRATAIESKGGMVLVISGVELTATDHAMQGARVIVGDAGLCAALRDANYDAMQPDSVVVTAKLSQDTGDALRVVCKAKGLAMSTALAFAVEHWLQDGSPCDSKNAINKGCGRRGK